MYSICLAANLTLIKQLLNIIKKLIILCRVICTPPQWICAWLGIYVYYSNSRTVLFLINVECTKMNSWAELITLLIWDRICWFKHARKYLVVKNTLSIGMYAICVAIILSDENNCSQICEFIFSSRQCELISKNWRDCTCGL